MEKRFVEIFTGLKRDYGYADPQSAYKDPSTGKLKIEHFWAKQPVTEQDYENHLKGIKPIGIQPCDDEGMAKFGAIDIDSKAYDKFDTKKYLEIIDKNKIPVIPVKSKSGGLHLYVFTDKPVKATFIKSFLEKLLYTFSLKPSTEVYPKQTELDQGPNGTSGNFINLPYFKKQERVGLNLDGTTFTFEQFIKVIEANTKTKEELDDFINAHIKNILTGGNEEFTDGPPCLQIITKDLSANNKLADYRDRFLYNYMVFAKKKYGDIWDKKVLQAARDYIVYDNEWGDEKVKKKIKAWEKETAGHTCDEEPIHDHCMKSECAKRQFGFLSDKIKRFPPLTALIKINYSPDPEFRFTITYVDKKEGEVSKQVVARDATYFTNQDRLRTLIAAHTPIFPPRVTNKDYQIIMENLYETQNVESPPPGTSDKELLQKHLEEYVTGVQAVSDTSFRNGSTLIDDGYAYFVFEPFFNHLKNKEWKIKLTKTGRMMEDFFKAELSVSKRYPKKDSDTKSNNPVRCVKISMQYFNEEDNELEILDMKDKEDIL